MLLQLSAKADLGAVLPAGPVVREDKVGVATVQHCQLTEWIGHGLVGSGHLEQTKFCLVELSSSSVQSSFFFCFVSRTSRPIRSSLFSIIPHGAMPMAQTFPLDLDE